MIYMIAVAGEVRISYGYFKSKRACERLVRKLSEGDSRTFLVLEVKDAS